MEDGTQKSVMRLLPFDFTCSLACPCTAALLTCVLLDLYMAFWSLKQACLLAEMIFQ
jgi:hypothetical protein